VRVGQITPAVLRTFKKKLASAPHLGSRKPLDARAVTATMSELRALLKWWRRGIEGTLSE
jgi:hypothetical protein